MNGLCNSVKDDTLYACPSFKDSLLINFIGCKHL